MGRTDFKDLIGVNGKMHAVYSSYKHSYAIPPFLYLSRTYRKCGQFIFIGVILHSFLLVWSNSAMRVHPGTRTYRYPFKNLIIFILTVFFFVKLSLVNVTQYRCWKKHNWMSIHPTKLIDLCRQLQLKNVRTPTTL